MWYWYFTGMMTVILVQSVVLNALYVTGIIRWQTKPKGFRTVRVYDQDNSGQYKRIA